MKTVDREVEPDSKAALRRYDELHRPWLPIQRWQKVMAGGIALVGLLVLGATAYAVTRPAAQSIEIFTGSRTAPSAEPSSLPKATPATAVSLPTPVPYETVAPAPVVVQPLAPVVDNPPASTPTPYVRRVLWRGIGVGNFTSPQFAVPTGNATLSWSYDCSTAPSPYFGIRAWDAGSGQSTGGLGGNDIRVKAGGEASFTANPGYVVIQAQAHCSWSVSVSG